MAPNTGDAATPQKEQHANVDVLAIVTGNYRCSAKKGAEAVNLILSQTDRVAQLATLADLFAFWEMPESPNADQIPGHVHSMDKSEAEFEGLEVAMFLTSVVSKSGVPDRSMAESGPEGFDTFIGQVLDLLLQVTAEGQSQLRSGSLVMAQAMLLLKMLEDGSLHREVPQYAEHDAEAAFNLIVQNPETFRSVDAMMNGNVSSANVIGYILSQNLDNETKNAFIALAVSSLRQNSSQSFRGIEIFSGMGGLDDLDLLSQLLRL